MPVLTKSGCNAGACHGAAAGRGGFRLSLYGGDPAFDYESIVRDQRGRRVNLAKPDASLVLLKPMETLEHGGGYRLELDGEGQSMLQRWIEQGAQRNASPRVERLEVDPSSIVVGKIGEAIQLRATAHFADHSTDVTGWTVFTPEDDSAVRVDPDTALARVLRRGRHIVVARYLQHVVPLEILVPFSDEPVDLAGEPRHNFVDEQILARLQTLRIPASPTADDETFQRRITLDLTGRLPSVDDAREFALDPEPDKRKRLIDRLLDSEEFNDYWTLQFAKLLRIRSQPQDTQGARTYHGWLRSQIAEARPYDELVRELVMATGDSHELGPANFYRTADGPRKQAEFVSELLMGNRLRCANCHNHPLDRWTQDDYHGLAAIFARLTRGRVISVSNRGDVIHPRTGESAVPRIPGLRFLERQSDGREALVNWLTAPENPWFAKAVVNRLWKAMMGRGLVEPTDDLRDTNPATHPELLELLADDFVRKGYDLRHTLRQIASSSTYARSAAVEDRNQADDRFLSHATVRPFPPEVLADAIADVTGVNDQYGDEPAGARAVTLFDPKIPSPSLDILGRCSREESCEGTVETGGLTRKLHLLNGGLLNRRILTANDRLSQLLDAGTHSEKIVSEFYERALSRRPTQAESGFWKQQLAAAKNSNDTRAVLSDFVWSLLTCREFVTNH